MNEQWLCKEIEKDLQAAAAGRGVVLYLEGKTDVPILLALLGARDEREVSGGVLHDGVLIRGLRDRGGSGSSAVKQRLDVAQRRGYPGIFGVLDGDGAALGTLASEFDAPHPGPLFRWKGYCIENLLASACWPEAWGVTPEWSAVLAAFAPYVALNRLGFDVRRRLERLRLDRFLNPDRSRPLEATEVFVAKLRDGKHELLNLEIEAMFSVELDAFMAALATSLDDAHALLNGKWLVSAFAPQHTGRTQEQCRDEWAMHLRSIGGDPEIKAWWRRTVAP
jgi:hypothetical protein